MAKTADRLLEGIKRRAVVPSSQALFDDDDILAMADDVIEELLVPILKASREEYFVTSYSQTVTSGTASYDIPYRAVGRALRDVKLVDGTTTTNLVKIAVEDEHLFSSGGGVVGFYLKGDKIVLVDSPTSTSLTLQLWYEARPNRLVTLASAGTVASFTSTTVTVSSAPTTITTGTVVDFIQGKSGNSPLAMDKTVTNAAGTTYTFASGAIPSDLAVGDYVSVFETAPVVMLPPECYPLLETATTKRVLDALGDFEGAAKLMEAESEEAKRLKTLLEPRISGEPAITVNRNGLLRGRRYLRSTIFRGGSV